MDRIERLVNLVAALLDAERPLRAFELRERIPRYPDGDIAFHRAFSRDKATLRAMEIPLTVEWLDEGDPENGQGYRVPKQRYELPDIGLDADEVAALHLASTIVRLEGGEATEAIWKLGGVGPGAAPVDVTAAATASLPGSEHLGALFGAVADRRSATFSYRGRSRTVDPWRLSFRNGFWYLAGLDHDRGERRTFRLDRLDDAPGLGPPGAFQRAEGDDRSAPSPTWEMGDEEPVEVEILVDADQMMWAVAATGEDAVAERHTNGDVLLRLNVTNRAALRTFVLGMLEHAEIIAPPSERMGLVEWVRAGRGAA